MCSTLNNPKAALLSRASNFRAGTLRKRVRAWRRLRAAWLDRNGIEWPTVIDIINMTEAMCDSSKAKTLAVEIGGTLSFLESAGAVRYEDRITRHPFLGAYFKSITMNQLGKAKTPESMRAMSFHPIWLLAMELHFWNNRNPTDERVAAWTCVQMFWTSERTNDVSGLMKGSVRKSHWARGTRWTEQRRLGRAGRW